MSLPANIRINVPVPFPAQVVGGNFISITKASGIYTVKANYALLASLGSVADPSAKQVVIFDPVTLVYNTMTLAALLASLGGTYRIITAAGDVTVLSSDVTILMNKSSGAATNINLPTSASRGGVPLTIKDYKGDANTNNITCVLADSEKLDGLTQANADTAGLSKIDMNYGFKTLYPLTAGGWYLR